ncbi:nucleoside deaminase [Nitrogeniibacter aestuarii]|uniref:nucleoside deaminase n=1 Tax=Nitrogeniibacter aestuarii TaxID=2815343 RepID=UPI001D11D0CF|nr:nucleoside deaminase [Nitrogeniibacter aestuarii]
MSNSLCFDLPDWLDVHAAAYVATADVEARMAFVVDAARRNVAEGTGGPFAAGVFEQVSGRLVALGVNLVTTQGLSMLHAEVVALALAQRRLATYDLGAAGLPPHELVTSTEPCTMCLGAIGWSGVSRVVSGATDADARSVGFDEGPKPPDWAQALAARGISVNEGVGRAAARAVLDQYRAQGGHIYNSREGR